jgi:hypothetical protein
MIRLMARCLFGIYVGLLMTSVSAQDAPAIAVERKGEPIIRRAPQHTLIWVDLDGSEVFKLPGGWPLTLADTVNKIVFGKDQQNAVSPFVISTLSATGKVLDKYVEVSVQIEIATSVYQPVRVPLGFKEGILPSKEQTNQPAFRYAGPGTAEISFDEGQYIAIISPQAPQPEKPEIDQRHTLSLLLWVQHAQNGGGENRLALSFPQANSSQLQLEVPMSNVDVTVTMPSLLLNSQENAERQSTLLTIQGLRTDTKIVWSKKEVTVVEDRPVLLVDKATIDVRLDAGSAEYDAVLPVSSAAGSFDQLQIRLPQGCILDRAMTDQYAAGGGYSVSDVNEESVITLQFPQKTNGPVSLRLRGRQQFEGGTPDFQRELAGFEVLGAESQAGFLNVSIFPPEMNPHWEPVRGVRRTEAGAVGTSTRFEFISQPFLLRVQVAPQQTRINVKPDYEFRISKGVIELTARLSYTISGSKRDTLYLDLFDSQWHYEFGMSSPVNTAGVELNAAGQLTIPLRTPMERSVEIVLYARRPIPSTEEGVPYRLVLPMPKPRADWSESAPVFIFPDNNVRVVPINESYSAITEKRIRGMTLQTRRTMPPIRVDLTDMQQEPLLYRTEPAGAEFVADLTFHQQEVKAAMLTEVHLLEEHSPITQTITYTALYEPVDRLYVVFPKVFETTTDITVRLDNRILELQDTISDGRDNLPDTVVRKLIQLPEARFQAPLVFEYVMPPQTTAVGDSARSWLLPFICPSEVPVSGHRIHFFTPPGFRVELHNESKPLWESYREPRRSTTSATETFRSTLSPQRISLLISASDKNVFGGTIVECAWLQTWLTGTLRVDRATYRMKSASDLVMLQLPREAAKEYRVIVSVDKQEISPNISSTGMLTLPILPEQRNRPIEVFVEYRFALDTTGVEVPLMLPTFAKETLVQSQYWQVILDQDRHIVNYPLGWTLEYDWTWNGMFFGRVPSIRKSDLGFLSDSDDTEPAISGTSQYVFNHMQPPTFVTLYIVNRSLIILCSSSVVLLIGLVLIYVPQSRYVGSLFGLAIAMIAALFYQPPLVLLMSQAAVFGIFLALVAGYIYRIFHRQKQWIPSAFPLTEDISQPYPTPAPQLTVHEVVMDDGSTSEDMEPSVINNGPT